MIDGKREKITLCEHDDEWHIQAYHMKVRLAELTKDMPVIIEHIGSTAMYNVMAVPIIDMLIAVDDKQYVEMACELLAGDGFVREKASNVPFSELFYLTDGERHTFHIYVAEYGGFAWERFINFRRYMNKDEDNADWYNDVKITHQCDPIELYNKYKNIMIDGVMRRLKYLK